MKQVVILLASVFMLASCGGNDQKTDSTDEQTTTAPAIRRT